MHAAGSKQSFGFCRDHAWQAADVGGTLLGMSIIYRGLLGQIDKALAQATPGDQKRWWQKLGTPHRLPNLVPRQGLRLSTPCPACLYLAGMGCSLGRPHRCVARQSSGCAMASANLVADSACPTCAVLSDWRAIKMLLHFSRSLPEPAGDPAGRNGRVHS